MKKVLFVLSLPVLAAGLVVCLNNSPKAVFAEPELESSEVEPEPTTSEEPVTSESESEIVDESTLEEVKGFLSKYIDSQMVANIITWCSEAGVLVGLLGVYVKYRKFKGKTLEDLIDLFKKEMQKWLEENFKKLSDAEITKITNSVSDLEKAQETIMKVLVLMQDSTKKGKIALLDFLGSKTKNEEVKEMAEDLSEELVEEEKKDEEIREAVKEDYEKIF